MIKKILILFSFLIIANQISAQQDQISFINNTGIQNNNINLFFADDRNNSLGTNVINPSSQKQTFNVPNGTKKIALAFSKQIKGVCDLPVNGRFPSVIQFIPGKTYTITKGNCQCSGQRHFVCKLDFNVS